MLGTKAHLVGIVGDSRSEVRDGGRRLLRIGQASRCRRKAADEELKTSSVDGLRAKNRCLRTNSRVAAFAAHRRLSATELKNVREHRLGQNSEEETSTKL